MTAPDRDRLIGSAEAVADVLAPRLVAWQRAEGRHHLPWQGTQDPYRVWLSEIMLQQTQVSTVLGYYARFLRHFPTVVDLANAPLDEVLALWSGLGYYSRARNLHACAQGVRDLHGGAFPQTAEALQTLPGIGRSTAAAVAAFCFSQRTPILDGNVKRVLTRVLGWAGDLSVSAHERALWQAAEVVLPGSPTDMPAWTQGLMDLGATLCTPRKPSCLVCPWSDVCEARRGGDPEKLPVKTRKLKRSRRENWCLWVEHNGHVWMVQRPGQGIWAGLWTLPLFADEAQLQAAAGPHAASLEPQPAVNHVLTHLDWRLHPRRVSLTGEPTDDDLARWVGLEVAPPADGAAAGRWVPLTALAQWGLPAPIRRLLAP